MSLEKLFEKLNQILRFVEEEADKPLDNHNNETKLWSKGYRKAMLTTRDFIWKILNKNDL